jgi:hypothetical protein
VGTKVWSACLGALVNRTRPVLVDAFVGFAKIVGLPFLRQHHGLIYVNFALAVVD